MNIYRISCYSKCGSYFTQYLQSVTVKANSKEEALAVVKEWLKVEGKSFIYPENKWEIDLLSVDANVPSVIDYHEDSDY